KWDEEWLRLLHLFTVVAVDAGQSAAHLGTDEREAVDLDNFFSMLIERGQSRIYTLLGSYAEQDAVAAMRVAQLSGLGILDTLFELVVVHWDQPGFLELVKRDAENASERRHEWAVLLAEAGLRSAAVGHGLGAMKGIAGWSAEVDDLPLRDRWFGRSGIV